MRLWVVAVYHRTYGEMIARAAPKTEGPVWSNHSSSWRSNSLKTTWLGEVETLNTLHCPNTSFPNERRGEFFGEQSRKKDCWRLKMKKMKTTKNSRSASERILTLDWIDDVYEVEIVVSGGLNRFLIGVTCVTCTAGYPAWLTRLTRGRTKNKIQRLTTTT